MKKIAKQPYRIPERTFKVVPVDKPTPQDRIAIARLNTAVEEYSNLIEGFTKDPDSVDESNVPKTIEDALNEIACVSRIPEIELRWQKNQVLIQKRISKTPWARITK